jgi:assimilatory nitrate reductase catalytic subunit
VARLYANAPSAMTIWTVGINQSTNGSDGVVAINNLNLITGNIGKPGGTSLSITGQCNAMGTREWSSCSGLPGYRTLEKEQDRREMAEYWGIDADFFPDKRGLFMTDILPAIETGQIKGLWLIATNPMTSMPNTARIRKTLEKLEFLVVQDAYADVETNEYSHVFLPAAIWAEKEGVFTNTERRVNLIRNVIEPFGESKPDFWIFNSLAKRIQRERKPNFPETTEQVFEEMKELSGGRMLTTFGKTYLARNIGLGVNAVLVLVLAAIPLSGAIGLSLWALTAVSITVLAAVGRALFYVVVIPTTMPGAFFWKNPGVQDHARDTGLAAMQQVGVQIVEH